jgi:TNF receptor-associated protein 1
LPQFISDSSDQPAARLHFTADAPIDIRALLYVPATMDDMFQSEEESKVSLYARRVLIQRNCSSVLPPFLRFVRGVVDCADIPLSISREHMQDSALIARIKTVMTNRVVRWLGDEAKKEDGKA